MRKLLVPIFAVSALEIALFSCGGASVAFPDAGPDDSGAAGEDGASPPPMDAVAEDAPACAMGCTGDLHSVVDCHGTVTKTCNPDQACAPGGVCMPACDAARAQKSSIGCDYYAVNPGAFSELHGDCFAAFVANTWTSDLSIDVSYGGQALNVANFARVPMGSGNSITYAPLQNGKLAPGQVAILFLADATAVTNPQLAAKCPQGVTAGVTSMDTASPNTEYIKAFRITTSLPATAFDIFPYGGSAAYATSATMLLPVSSWGTSHVAVHGYARSQAHMGDHLFLQLVSDENGNQVTIDPTAAIVGGTGVAATAQGQPHTYTIDKGQVLQIMQDGDLGGSPITSTKPLGLWGGNQCFNVEVTDNYCDTSHQELPPSSALASEYVAVRHPDRGGSAEVPPWRIAGAVDGTQLTYLPQAPNGAPTTINAKQVVKFTASGPFVIKSQDAQHPFYFAGHMMGGSTVNGTNIGDPEHVNVIPPAQWLESYLFMTDPTMHYTSVVLVRGKASDQTYKDVKLDCQASAVAGWQTISGTDYQYAVVSLVANGSGVGGCDNGARSAASTWPFALTVWGWDNYVSYAYPGGASVRPVNGVILPMNDM